MKHLRATEAARRFSELLDAVEQQGETFVVSRHGRVVARISPTHAANGQAVKEILRANPPDQQWAAELRDLRNALSVEERRWND